MMKGVICKTEVMFLSIKWQSSGTAESPSSLFFMNLIDSLTSFNTNLMC